MGARQGHFPDFLALINYECNTPATSLVFLVGLDKNYFLNILFFSIENSYNHNVIYFERQIQNLYLRI